MRDKTPVRSERYDPGAKPSVGPEQETRSMGEHRRVHPKEPASEEAPPSEAARVVAFVKVLELKEIIINSSMKMPPVQG